MANSHNLSGCESTIRVYAVDVSLLSRLSHPAEFWAVIQNGARLVASLPTGSGEAVAIVKDYLACEARISVSPGHATDVGIPVAAPRGVEVVVCISQPAAKRLRSAMAKNDITVVGSPRIIVESYGYRHAHSTQLCQQAIALFSDLSTFFQGDNEQLLVLMFTDTTRDLLE